jgi:hypothetical protein
VSPPRKLHSLVLTSFVTLTARVATPAAVRELNELFLGPRQLRATTPDERRVDVYLAHIVHDDGDPLPFTVAQQVIEKFGFPAPRKPDRTVTGKRPGT